MGRARGLEQWRVQQESGHFLLRDGHDRGTLHAMYYFVTARVYCDFVPIQIFTGAAPFSDSHPLMAVLSVTQGKRPPRPTHPAFTKGPLP